MWALQPAATWAPLVLFAGTALSNLRSCVKIICYQCFKEGPVAHADHLGCIMTLGWRSSTNCCDYCKTKEAKIKIIEYKNFKCVGELRADRGKCNLWKTLYIDIIAIKEVIFPYLGLLKFLMEVRVRGELNGNLGPNKSRELLLAGHRSSCLIE